LYVVTPVDPPIEIDVPAVEPTNIFRVEAIVAAVIAEADEVVPIVNRPPSKVIDVVAPSAPLSLKITSPPVMATGPLKVFAVFPIYVCPVPAPLKVRPDPVAPEITPV
jgi:hypothetical protein